MLKTGSHTPWGAAQDVTELAPGIVSVSTASHGGIKVCSTMNKRIPAVFRCADGWYEEDCDWAIPFFFLVNEIINGGDSFALRAIAAEQPRKTLIAWHPDEWEAHTGEELIPGQSFIKDERARTGNPHHPYSRPA